MPHHLSASGKVFLTGGPFIPDRTEQTMSFQSQKACFILGSAFKTLDFFHFGFLRPFIGPVAFYRSVKGLFS